MMTLGDCRAFYAQEVRWAANVSSQALIDAYARVPREKYLGPPPWQIASLDMRALAISGIGGATQRKADEPRDAAKPGPTAAGRPVTTYRSTDDPRDLYHNVVVALDAGRDLNNGQPSALALRIEALELKPGERVYHLGCGAGYYTAIMAKITCLGGAYAAEIVSPIAVYSCSSVRDPQLEPILMKALGNGSLFKLKSVRTDPHEPAETCILHRSEVCVSSGEPAAPPIPPERERESGHRR